MRLIVQIGSALLLASGIGLLALGEAQVSMAREFGDPTDIGRANRTEEQYDADRRRDTARYIERVSILRGWGAGLATLGVVGVIVPWVNALVLRHGLVTPNRPDGRSG